MIMAAIIITVRGNAGGSSDADNTLNMSGKGRKRFACRNKIINKLVLG